MKHKREDYKDVGDLHVTDPATGTLYWVEVLCVLEEIIRIQGPLALASRFNKNKQIYGPFMVRVHVQPRKKEHRKKKKQ